MEAAKGSHVLQAGLKLTEEYLATPNLLDFPSVRLAEMPHYT